MQLDLVDVDIFSIFLQYVEKVLPDFLSRRGVEVGIMKRDLHSRAEGFVEGADTVAGENEDTFVIFKDTEKNYD